MDSKDFQESGTDMIRYIANYLDTLSNRRVTPTVEPGYLRKMLPKYAPRQAESFRDIMKDVENVIMPGVSNKLSPLMCRSWATFFRQVVFSIEGNRYTILSGHPLLWNAFALHLSWDYTVKEQISGGSFKNNPFTIKLRYQVRLLNTQEKSVTGHLGPKTTSAPDTSAPRHLGPT